MSNGGGGGGGGGGKVTIPSNMRKTIQNIKEIAGNHSDEEIYIMLKECNMDPNETAQKLLFQDTFHEVKRKRDRKKENVNQEASESRWKPGMQGRGTRGGRGNYSSRYGTHDAVGTRKSVSGKDNEPGRFTEESGGISMPPTPKDVKHKVTSRVSSTTVTIDGSSVVASQVTGAIQAGSPFTGGNNKSLTAAADISKAVYPLPIALPPEGGKTTTIAFATADAPKQGLQISSNIRTSKTSASASEVHSAASDPALVSSQDSRLLDAVGTIKCEVGVQQNTPEQVLVVPSESKLTAVVPIKEWKPKPTNNIAPQVSAEVPVVPVEATKSQPATSVIDSKPTHLTLEDQLKESHIADSQLVIIPDHLHVPEVEKLGFCFGSFDANFGLDTNYSGASDNNKNPLPETTEKIEEIAKEQSSNLTAMATAEEEGGPKCAPASSQVSRSLTTSDSDVSSTLVVPEYCESKQETDLPSGGNQYPSVSNSPTYGFGVMPTVVTSQVTPTGSTESVVHDVSRVPSYMVQQPFDLNSYYAQFYRTGADTDTRISPFHSPGFATKYNGNVAMLSPQASQSSQEVANSLILSTAGPTPLVTQAAGIMQSSVAVTQQPLPVFRQPAGVHLPHYPTNYFPYGHYYSPIYVPPPAIHQFINNGAFPPQPQPGSLYPTPPVASTKYPLSQYKQGNNAGNSTQVGSPGSYGTYGSSPAGFNTSSATSGNSTSGEDLVSPHLKENNVYITGQQSEGSGVWLGPGRDISGLQATSFYNLPQAQMAFTATQASHGNFASIYHPSQPVTAAAVHSLLQPSQAMAGAVDVAGPTASVYQPSQPAAINWPNNY